MNGCVKTHVLISIRKIKQAQQQRMHKHTKRKSARDWERGSIERVTYVYKDCRSGTEREGEESEWNRKRAPARTICPFQCAFRTYMNAPSNIVMWNMFFEVLTWNRSKQCISKIWKRLHAFLWRNPVLHKTLYHAIGRIARRETTEPKHWRTHGRIKCVFMCVLCNLQSQINDISTD